MTDSRRPFSTESLNSYLWPSAGLCELISKLVISVLDRRGIPVSSWASGISDGEHGGKIKVATARNALNTYKTERTRLV